MAQAIGDPEELERFAYSLQQFIDSLNDAVGNLNGAFASLGDTWQDDLGHVCLCRHQRWLSRSGWRCGCRLCVLSSDATRLGSLSAS